MPHVAGADALFLEENPSLMVDQLPDELINNARFKASYSVNNLCGANSGALQFSPCVPQTSGDWIISFSCTLSSSEVAPGNVIVQNNSVLTIPAGLSLDIDFVNNFLKIEFGRGARIKAGES